MTIFSMTSTLVQKLECQLLNKYSCHRKNCLVDGLAYKLEKFYSSPDCSIPLFSLFSFLEIPLVNRTVKNCQKTCCSFTRANVLDSEKLGNETGSPVTRARKFVIENCHRKLVA